MMRLVTAGLIALSLYGQNIPSAQNQDDLARAAKNPFDLARFIDSHLLFDWNVMWTALHSEPQFIQPCGKLSDGKEQCSTELITVLNPDQIILVVEGDVTPADIYQRFLQEKDGSWRFEGAFGAEIHNHPRRHEVDRVAGKPFLRISSQGLRGSDVDSEMEDWFDLTQLGFEPVFSFPVQGHQSRLGFGIGRSLSSAITSQKDEIDVYLQIQFSIFMHQVGTAGYSAVYKRSNGAAKFSLESAEGSPGIRIRSKMATADFEALVDLDQGPSNEVLIRYAMPGLKEIASGPDNEAKNRLRQMLATVSATPEVRELKSLLR